MTLNTQNSFLISAFLHLLFIAAFVAMPKPEYKVRQLSDISFLFSNIEGDAQINEKIGDKPVLKSKVEPMKTEYQKDSRQAGMTSQAEMTATQKLEDPKVLSEPLKENEINQEYQKKRIVL